MPAKTKPVREPWEKYGQRRHTTYTGAMDQLQAFERDQHSADAQRRANREPHKQTLAVQLDTSGTHYAYSLAERCIFVEDVKERNMVRKATLDSWGIPAFPEGVILRMEDTKQPIADRPLREYLTPSELASVLDIHDSTIRDSCMVGGLVHVRTGGPGRGHYRITVVTLPVWLERSGYQPEQVTEIMRKVKALLAREARFPVSA